MGIFKNENILKKIMQNNKIIRNSLTFINIETKILK